MCSAAGAYAVGRAQMYQLHSTGGQPPPVQDCIAFDTSDDECPTAFFCCPCAFLQLAAEWRVRDCFHG